MKRAHTSLFSFFLFMLLNTLLAPTSSAQIIGGREGGQPLPGEVKAAALSGGAYQGDVNLFNGTYSASYPLGSVATPGGLSFTVSLGYSSTFAAGNNVPVVSGIPYGEGWSLSLPSLSVSTEAFRAYSEQDYCNYANELTNGYYKLDSLMPVPYLDGDLFWFAPTVSIPGAGGGRAVFKYLENGGNTAVFVLNEFEQYLELRLTGNYWEVRTADGTVYEFNIAKKSQRSASNGRIFEYADTRIQGDTLNRATKGKIENTIMPKGEIMEWYCTRITNTNLPGQQEIVLEYETFGQFNYYREFVQEYQAQLASVLTAYTPLYFSAQLLSEKDFSVYTDVFLKQVTSQDRYSLTDRLVLNYGTEFGHPTQDMLGIGQAGVQRLDSLYNYRSEYYMGGFDNTSTALPTAGRIFQQLLQLETSVACQTRCGAKMLRSTPHLAMHSTRTTWEKTSTITITLTRD